MRSTTWVYLHRDPAGGVIYVGATQDLRRRNRVHRHGSPWRDRIAAIEVDGYYPHEDALDREKALIRLHEPEFNVLWEQGRHVADQDAWFVNVWLPATARRSVVDAWLAGQQQQAAS